MYYNTALPAAKLSVTGITGSDWRLVIVYKLVMENKSEKINTVEMLSFGGAQFASYIFMAFSSYYLMMFFTDVALISPAITAVFMVFYRLFDAADNQVIGLFINRTRFNDGKYRPYFKW